MPLELLNFQFLLPALAVVAARVTGMVIAVPLFASQQIPRVIMAGLVVIVSLMVFPVVAPLVPSTLTMGQALAGLLGEFVIGELLGLGAGLVFYAAQVAGQIVSHQSGLALSAVFNPLFDEQSTVLDEVWFFFTMIFFLGLRGHLAVMEVMLGSFRQVPPLQMTLDPAIGDLTMGLVRSLFDLALRLSGPAILALLLSSLLLGFLTKTMPQLNVLSVGFALKIGIALVLVALTLQHAGPLIESGALSGLDQVGGYLAHVAEVAGRGG